MTQTQIEEAADRTDEAGGAVANRQPENPLARRMDVSLAVDEIDALVNAVLKEEGKRVNLKGFRPGKLPLKILQQRFGQETLQRVLIEQAKPRLQAEMEKQGELLATPPNVSPTLKSSDGAYPVALHYEVLPVVVAADFTGKTLKVPMLTIGDAEIDEMIERLRIQHGRYVPVTDKASEGGRLTVDAKIFQADSGELIEEAENRLVTLIEGVLEVAIKDALMGSVVGDVRQVTLPQEAPIDGATPSKAVRMEMTVKSVEALEKAVLDNSFFQAIHAGEDIDIPTFRQMVATHLNQEVHHRLRNILHNRAMDVLIVATPPFDLPRSMVYNEAYDMFQLENQRSGNASQKATLTVDRFFPEAQRRVALGLIMAAWQQREKPEITMNEIEARLHDMVLSYESPEAIKAQLRKDKKQMEAIRLSLLESRVVEWVRDQLTCEEEKINLSNLLGPSVPTAASAPGKDNV